MLVGFNLRLGRTFFVATVGLAEAFRVFFLLFVGHCLLIPEVADYFSHGELFGCQVGALEAISPSCWYGIMKCLTNLVVVEQGLRTRHPLHEGVDFLETVPEGLWTEVVHGLRRMRRH